jgi:hypothetical protein
LPPPSADELLGTEDDSDATSQIDGTSQIDDTSEVDIDKPPAYSEKPPVYREKKPRPPVASKVGREPEDPKGKGKGKAKKDKPKRPPLPLGLDRLRPYADHILPVDLYLGPANYTHEGRTDGLSTLAARGQVAMSGWNERRGARSRTGIKRKQLVAEAIWVGRLRAR